MIEMPDILFASGVRRRSANLLGRAQRVRQATLDSWINGRVSPGQITIIDVDSPRELPDVEVLAKRLKVQLAAGPSNYVILSYRMPEDRDGKIRRLVAFEPPELDHVEISDDRRLLAKFLGNVLAKIESAQRRPHSAKARP